MRQAVLDANLLLLQAVGRGSRADIAVHKRLHPKWTGEHFDLLLELLAQFSRIVVTPHVLTETGNLIDMGQGQRKLRSKAAFAALISGMVEVFDPARALVLQPEFDWLGLSDTAQIVAGSDRRTVVTADAGLYVACERRDVPAINFWHAWERSNGL